MLTNPHDHADAVRARESQADPLVMYIVARESGLTTMARLAAAVAPAVVAADRRFRADPAYAAVMDAWHAASFRKIALRAKDREWDRLLAEWPAAVRPDPVSGDALVAVLPAIPRSTAGGLRRLQALVKALPSGSVGASGASGVRGAAAVFALNPALGMGSGKAAAAIGHAALMLADACADLGAGSEWLRPLAAWEASGWQAVLADATHTGWRSAIDALPCVAVTDSGLTEVDPGSRTALAVMPGDAAACRAAIVLLGG